MNEEYKHETVGFLIPTPHSEETVRLMKAQMDKYKPRLEPVDEYKTMIGKCTDWVVKDKLINDILYEVREIVEHKVSYELADEIEAKIKKIYGVE